MQLLVSVWTKLGGTLGRVVQPPVCYVDLDLEFALHSHPPYPVSNVFSTAVSMTVHWSRSDFWRVANIADLWPKYVLWLTGAALLHLEGYTLRAPG